MNYQDDNISDDDDDSFISTPEINIILIHDLVDNMSLLVPNIGHMERIGVVNDNASSGG